MMLRASGRAPFPPEARTSRGLTPRIVGPSDSIHSVVLLRCAARKFAREEPPRKPAVPKREEAPLCGLKSEKDFVVANAVDAILTGEYQQCDRQAVLTEALLLFRVIIQLLVSMLRLQRPRGRRLPKLTGCTSPSTGARRRTWTRLRRRSRRSTSTFSHCWIRSRCVQPRGTQGVVLLMQASWNAYGAAGGWCMRGCAPFGYVCLCVVVVGLGWWGPDG